MLAADSAKKQSFPTLLVLTVTGRETTSLTRCTIDVRFNQKHATVAGRPQGQHPAAARCRGRSKQELKSMCMKTKIQPLFLAALVASGAWAPADVLELKNGTILNGKYSGGSANAVNFTTTAGIQVIDTAQIVALTFTAPAPPQAVAPAPAATPARGAQTIPAGTPLLVRVMDPVSSKNSAGATFTTKLEQDLVVNNVVVVKAGTTIYGKVQSSTRARRAAGKSTLELRLAQMVVGSTTVPIVTSDYKEAGANSLRKTAGGAAVGAGVGAVVDGGDGAAKGAAIGAAASLLKKGETVTVPPGTLLEFTLMQPVTVSAG